MQCGMSVFTKLMKFTIKPVKEYTIYDWIYVHRMHTVFNISSIFVIFSFTCIFFNRKKELTIITHYTTDTFILRYRLENMAYFAAVTTTAMCTINRTPHIAFRIGSANS